MLRILNLIAFWLLLLAGVAGVVWFIVRTVRRSDDPPRLLVKWLVTFIILGLLGLGIATEVGYSFGGAFMVPFVCVLIGLILSILWTPHLGAFLSKPLTSIFDGGDADWEPEPFYSVATALRKRGQFEKAIEEIHKQLARWPNDFAGQMLLAQIQAENLKDLQAASLTIDALCGQSGHAPSQIADALHQLADWRLSGRQDAAAAQADLERICWLFPGTEQERVARQRLARLGDGDARLGWHKSEPVRLRPGMENIGLRRERLDLQPAETEPAALVQHYLDQLERHPADDATREKLALLYAERIGRLDLALLELEELIERSNQPPKQVIHWLNLEADLHLKYAQDLPAARRQLERILERYPGLAGTEQARTRLARLPLELKGQQKSQAVQLGSYEQNIGLKQGRPTGPGKPSPRESDSPTPAE